MPNSNASSDEEFTMLRGRVNRLENGPPVGYPVQFRIMGDDIATLRKIAGSVAERMRARQPEYPECACGLE